MKLRFFGAFGRLEPDEGKLSRPVLRGGEDGNVLSLPDQGMEDKRVKKKARNKQRSGDSTLGAVFGWSFSVQGQPSRPSPEICVVGVVVTIERKRTREVIRCGSIPVAAPKVPLHWRSCGDTSG